MICVGEPAPDAVFARADGSMMQLSDLWRAAPTVLLFLRHFG